jgi:hypothetical protein
MLDRHDGLSIRRIRPTGCWLMPFADVALIAKSHEDEPVAAARIRDRRNVQRQLFVSESEERTADHRLLSASKLRCRRPSSFPMSSCAQDCARGAIA